MIGQIEEHHDALNTDSSKWSRGSSNWPVAGGWLSLALYSLLAAHRVTLGIVQVGMALAYGADEFLSKKAPSRLRLNTLRVLAVAVLVATFWRR
jgi:hypothetical protein